MSSFIVSKKAYLSVAALLVLCVAAVAQQKAEKSNMELVGYSDLQARSAYQPTIHKQGDRWIAYVGQRIRLRSAVMADVGDRWIAYVGHHGASQPNPLTGKNEDNGTPVVDGHDPEPPKY